MQKDFVVSKDGSNYYSSFRGLTDVAKIFRFGDFMKVGDIKTTYESVILQNDDEAVCVETQQVNIYATTKGIETERNSIAKISYNRITNTLTSDITKDSAILTMSDTRYGNETFMMSEHWALLIPVAEWLAKNKPYCYKVLEDLYGLSNYGNGCWMRNIIQMALFDKADEFERCYKFSSKVKEYCANEDLDDILKAFNVKAIPARCRDWLEKMSPIVGNEKSLTELLAKITEKEDGNNAIIFCKYFERAVKLMDRRIYNFGSTIAGFISNLSELIDMGYNSKDVLEYITRQNFYFYRPFGFPYAAIGNLCDYARMAKKIRGDGYERFPSNVIRSHNVILANQKMMDSVDEETEKAFKEEVDKYRCLEGEVYIPKQKKRWVIKAPSSSKEVIDEGIALNHCVSSYVDLIAQGASQILFLRDADEPDVPLYTVEVMGGLVTEAKGNYNEELPPEAVEALKEFQKTWKGKV